MSIRKPVSRPFAILALMYFVSSIANAQSSFDPLSKANRVLKHQLGFDTSQFYRVVADKIGDNYMGYAPFLRNAQGEPIVKAHYGYARTPHELDDVQAFTTKPVGAPGSVSKMITIAAAAQQRAAPRQIERAPDQLIITPAPHAVSGTLYDFPFKAGDPLKGDVGDNERVYLDDLYHTSDTLGTGPQKWGFDFRVRLYKPSKKGWVRHCNKDHPNDFYYEDGVKKDCTLGGDKAGNKNQHHYSYGKNMYAMREGTVIACWRNAPSHHRPGEKASPNWHEEMLYCEAKETAPKNCSRVMNGHGPSKIYGGANGLWVAHDDGSRAEYAHMQPGSVPASLCPNNAELLPVVIDTQTVQNAWPYISVPKKDQKKVKRGQYIGKVGHAGSSSGPHLHVHVETGGSYNLPNDRDANGFPMPKTDQNGDPIEYKYTSGDGVRIRFRRGLYDEYIDGEPHDGPYVKSWESFSGDPLPLKKMVIWPPRDLSREHARHGYPASQFPAMFKHLANSGLWPEWIDVYNVGGKNFYNYVWRPAERKWRAYYLIGPNRYQDVFTKAKNDGYAPVFVESSVSGRKDRYTMIFVKNKPGRYLARHGLSYDRHMAVMAEAKRLGLSPVNISVISLSGQRKYTVLYRKKNIGKWNVKSQIVERGYQAEYDKQTQSGRKPVYLNAYVHNDKPAISAIFAEVAFHNRRDRHMMSASKYQSEYESALKSGLLTRAVTSFDNAKSKHRFAASWWQK